MKCGDNIDVEFNSDGTVHKAMLPSNPNPGDYIDFRKWAARIRREQDARDNASTDKPR